MAPRPGTWWEGRFCRGAVPGKRPGCDARSSIGTSPHSRERGACTNFIPLDLYPFHPRPLNP